ncbi:MAG: hypothetical protein LJF06_07120 [Gemmatimonadetes bacterium]|nr:hypothetical protein [Gemmatimonadota bacterium]
MRDKADTRGFALPTAIGALVIVGVLVTAGFYMAQQEVRIGVASRYSALAVNLAQSGVNGVLVNNTSALTALPLWDTTTIVSTLPQGIVSVKATKVAQRLYFLDATATVTAGGALWSGATRRLGLYTRVSTANVDPPGALATQGQLKVGGSSIVSGNDTIPPAWSSECDASSVTNKPGIVIDDTTQIKVTGGTLDVYGNPAYAQDTTITSASLMSFGDLTWDDMVALAEQSYATGTTLTGLAADSTFVSTPSPGGYRCNTSNTNNWGDPNNPGDVCGNYFPIIYAQGDLSISGGYGQGILLVEGNLSVQGGFQFYGPVFVKGELSTSGTGGHFNGGVVAANFDLGTSSVLGNAVVTYSSCSVQRAILNNSALTKVRPMAMRSWVDLSGVLGG